LCLYYIILYYSGDVVIEVNNKQVNTVRDVLDEIGLEVGKRIEITVKRNGSNQKLVLYTAPESK
jgi:S1-C subfamily serine protease